MGEIKQVIMPADKLVGLKCPNCRKSIRWVHSKGTYPRKYHGICECKDVTHHAIRNFAEVSLYELPDVLFREGETAVVPSHTEDSTTPEVRLTVCHVSFDPEKGYIYVMDNNTGYTEKAILDARAYKERLQQVKRITSVVKDIVPVIGSLKSDWIRTTSKGYPLYHRFIYGIGKPMKLERMHLNHVTYWIETIDSSEYKLHDAVLFQTPGSRTINADIAFLSNITAIARNATGEVLYTVMFDGDRYYVKKDNIVKPNKFKDIQSRMILPGVYDISPR